MAKRTSPTKAELQILHVLWGAGPLSVRDVQQQLDKSKPTAVYCASGYRASIAASILKAEGFADVRNVPGSWHAWRQARYPVDRDPAQEKAA